MPIIKIDDKEYDTEKMSEMARTQLMHLQATEIEIQRLNMQVAIFQTARASYIGALKKELEQPGSVTNAPSKVAGRKGK